MNGYSVSPFRRKIQAVDNPVLSPQGNRRMGVVKEVERRSRALHRASFGCLRETWVLNVTRGCLLGCVYCYARGYADAPPTGEVELYRNLPQMLERELDSPRRRSRINWVAFNTASDSFQPHPDIQMVSRRSMEVLLKRGIGVSLLTKGWVEEATLGLLCGHSRQVHFQIGLISLDKEVWSTFEPKTAPPEVRLQQASRLAQAGVSVSARVDPVIPFITDRPADIRALMEAFVDSGIKRVTVSYLHLRPRIMDNLKAELPSKIFRLIWGCYAGREWQTVGSSTRSKLLPQPLRQRGYGIFREEARRLGVELLICACKNPDIPADLCSRSPTLVQRERFEESKRPAQLSLFPGISRSPAPDNNEVCPSP
jgi:DNA repair photolyase